MASVRLRGLAFSWLLLLGISCTPTGLKHELTTALDRRDFEQIEAISAASTKRSAGESIKVRRNLAAILEATADDLASLGHEARDTAAQLLREAVKIREETDPKPSLTLARILERLADTTSNDDLAEASLRRAIDSVPGDHPERAWYMLRLGELLASLYSTAEAEQYLLRGLAILDHTDPKDWSALAHGKDLLAEVRRQQNQYQEAEALLRESITTLETRVDEPTRLEELPYPLNNLAGIYRDQGKFGESLDLLRQTLNLRLELGDCEDIAIAKLNIAEVHRFQGRHADAEIEYRAALEIAEDCWPADELPVEFVNQLGVCLEELGRISEAEVLYSRARDMADETSLFAAYPLFDQARLLFTQGRYEEALDGFKKAAGIREKHLGADHPESVAALVAQAVCLAQMGQELEAERTAQAGVNRLEKSGAYPETLIEAHALLAKLRAQDRPNQALQHLEQAIQIVERLRPLRGVVESARATFFGRHIELYDRLIDIHVQQGDVTQAINVLEKSRARALLDQLEVAVSKRQPIDADLSLERNSLRAQIAEFQKEIYWLRATTDFSDEEAELIREQEELLRQATLEFNSLYDEILSRDSVWRKAASTALATAAEIQRSIVPSDGLVLLYQLGPQTSRVFVIPRSPDRPRAIRLELPDDLAGHRDGMSVSQAVQEGLVGLESGSGLAGGILQAIGRKRGLSLPGDSVPTRDDAQLIDDLHTLWKILVPEELRVQLDRAERVVIVPDRELNLLPFEALVKRSGPTMSDTEFWIDSGPIVRYAPSATFLKSVSESETRGASPDGVLSVTSVDYASTSGTSDDQDATSIRGLFARSGGELEPLMATAEETRRLEEAFRGVMDVHVLDGRRAREPIVLEAAKGKRYLHFATHGRVAAAGVDLFAGLALAPPDEVKFGEDDGFLELYELYDLELNSELAVLSACETNVGRLVQGEGLFALSRGFLVSGSRRVVASLWEVDDTSTAELIGGFFERIANAERAGEQPDYARALGQARLGLRSGELGEEYAHPFYWAPFIITGIK